jgi:hypothetical protein
VQPEAVTFLHTFFKRVLKNDLPSNERVTLLFSISAGVLGLRSQAFDGRGDKHSDGERSERSNKKILNI